MFFLIASKTEKLPSKSTSFSYLCPYSFLNIFLIFEEESSNPPKFLFKQSKPISVNNLLSFLFISFLLSINSLIAVLIKE